MWIEGRAVYREVEGGPARPVVIALDVRGLSLGGLDGRPVDFWPFGGLRRLAAPPNTLAIGVADSTSRVEIADPSTKAAFAAALKAIPAAGQPTIPTAFLAAAAALVALGVAVVAVLLWGLSAAASYAAPLVPEEVARLIDETAKPGVLADLGSGPDRQCSTAGGTAALARLGERLADAGNGRDMTLTIEVYRSPVANALALPGGTIVLTDALIEAAGSPDALAGVVAHEIGHVHHRHGLARMLHQGGLTLAFGVLVGDPAGIAAEATRLVVGADYSREAEREADRFAVGAVARAGGDARALGPLLERLAASGGEPAVAFLATHPMSSERRAAIDSMAADRTRGPGRVMSPADWSDLQAICDPD